MINPDIREYQNVFLELKIYSFKYSFFKSNCFTGNLYTQNCLGNSLVLINPDIPEVKEFPKRYLNKYTILCNK